MRKWHVAVAAFLAASRGPSAALKVSAAWLRALECRADLDVEEAQQAVLGERLQRLAHRRAAKAQRLRQRPLRQGDVGSDLARDDEVADPLIGIVTMQQD